MTAITIQYYSAEHNAVNRLKDILFKLRVYNLKIYIWSNEASNG